MAGETRPVSGLPDPASPDAILLTPLPTSGRRGPPGWRGLLWGLMAVLLGAALVLQLALFLRQELALAWPESRPLLEAACQRLGCSLPPPQDPAGLRIEASSLETDPEDASRAVLSLTLANRSGRTLAWPHLVLTLTDVQDAPIARRPFAPAEYLPPGSRPEAGMAAGAEREIRLELEFKGLSPYGYKLDKLYP